MTEHSQETKIAILEAKVEHMMGHVKELTLRVRANEKVVASVSLLGVIACTFIGAGYFAPKAEACSLPADGRPANCPEDWELSVKPDPTPQTYGWDYPSGGNYPSYLEPRTQVIPGSLPNSASMANEWINRIRQWEWEQQKKDPAFDINTLSSAFGEGFPNAIAEGMSCGTPSTATDTGDSREIIGDDQLISKPRDPYELANCWLYIYDKNVEERIEIGLDQRNRIINNYSKEIMLKKSEKLYLKYHQLNNHE